MSHIDPIDISTMRFCHSLIFFLFVFFPLHIDAQAQCTHKDSTGSYDLSPMTRSPSEGDYRFVKLTDTYYVNICKITYVYCIYFNTGVCQNSRGILTSCGSADSMSLSSLGPGKKGVKLTYRDGTYCGFNGRISNIEIECDANEPQGIIYDVNEVVMCEYTIKMKSKHACPAGGGSSSSGGDDGGSSGGLDGGWVFVIIVVSLMAVYFIGGTIYRKTFLHIEGADAIPNYEFWKELPALAKDGASFTMDKIRSKV